MQYLRRWGTGIVYNDVWEAPFHISTDGGKSFPTVLYGTESFASVLAFIIAFIIAKN